MSTPSPTSESSDSFVPSTDSAHGTPAPVFAAHEQPHLDFLSGDLPSRPILPGRLSVKGNTFSGKDDWFNLTDFLTTMNLQIRARQLSNDGQKILFVCGYLTGPAASWALPWLGKDPDNTTYTAFVDALTTHFLKKIDTHKILNALSRISEQRLGIESYNDYFDKLKNLLPPHFWSDQNAMYHYVRGLTNDTCRYVRLHKPTTLEEAQQAALEMVNIDDRSFAPNSAFIPDAEGDITMAAPILGYQSYPGYFPHPGFASQYSPTYPGFSGPQFPGTYAVRNTNFQSSNTGSPHPPTQRGGRGPIVTQDQCRTQNLCFYCKQPGHRISTCPVRPASSRR